MYSFDGEYKRTREQNLAGASRLASGKDELINRAHKERMKRQNERKRELSAIRIQKVIRGFLCRLRLKKKLNLEFGQWLRVCENRQTVPDDVQYLIARLHIVSRGGLYKTDLEAVTRKALSISNELISLASKDASWIWRLNVLLTYALQVIGVSPVSIPFDSTVLLVCDALETFTALNNEATPITIKKILLYLLHNNYMMVLRNFMLRIQCHYESFWQSSQEDVDNSEEMKRIVKMITRPITLLEESDETGYRDTVLDSLCKMVTVEKFVSAPIKDYILPSIKLKQDFPIESAVHRFFSYHPNMYVPSALYFFLFLDKDQTAISAGCQKTYFRLLSLLTRNLTCTLPVRDPPNNESPDLLEEIASLHNHSLKDLIVDTLKLLNTPQRSQVWLDALKQALNVRDFETVIFHCTCVMHVLLCDVTSPYRFRLIKDLWFAEGWLRGLWVIMETQLRMQDREPVPLLALLKRGTALTKDECIVMLPLLTVFCSFLFSSLSFLTDEDLLKPDTIMAKAVKPFTVNELMYISCTLKDVAVGLVSLGYPDPNFAPEDWYHRSVPTNDAKYNNIVWSQTLTECVKLVKEVYCRNERCEIISDRDWHSYLLAIPDNGIQCCVLVHDEVCIRPPFCTVTMYGVGVKLIGTWYDKAFTLLISLPFTVPFEKRYRMLWNILNSQMYDHQNPDIHFLHNPHLSTSIRRDYIYEDSFDKLSIDNAPELRMAVRIRFTNSLNMDEAGIDGGGIFREFITELLKTAFDPNRGFFILTKDNKLYPNPNVSSVYPNFTTHYFFIGRILAKAIFENIVVDIPLAEFFLAKVIDSASLYPSLLHTLDKDVFRNISYLRTYSEDYTSLGLDFTTSTNSFGSSEVIELVPNGSEIPVNSENVIEYIHLISKRKLHLDISKQTRAFTKGIGHVLPLHIIRMFTPKEIQLIISGDQNPIDINDMKINIIYSGGYAAAHPNIIMFWKVFETFNDTEKSLLLKFVTSCTRPPLCGFKDLHPPFCIQLVEGMDNRLPTSSTCMNILKLPLYTDENMMREKLLYAIQSGSGFELS